MNTEVDSERARTSKKRNKLPPPQSLPLAAEQITARLPVLSAHCIGLLHRNPGSWAMAVVGQSRPPTACSQSCSDASAVPHKTDYIRAPAQIVRPECRR